MPPETFDRFNDFPAEVRVRVWKLAALVPRNVDIWSHPLAGPQSSISKAYPLHPDPRAPPIRWVSHTSVPAILHATSESRHEALKYFSLEFGTEEKKDMGDYEMVVKSPAKIYINWDVDTVCPMRQSEKVIKHSVAARMRMGPAFVASTAQIQEQHPKICRLALNINDWDWTSRSYRHRKLEELILYYPIGSRSRIRALNLPQQDKISITFADVALPELEINVNDLRRGSENNCPDKEDKLATILEIAKKAYQGPEPDFEKSEDGVWKCTKHDECCKDLGITTPLDDNWEPPKIIAKVAKISLK